MPCLLSCEQPFKFEWSTEKQGQLYMGSIGKEWVDEAGKIMHTNTEWIKILDLTGNIRSQNWSREYLKLREATNTTRPGYFWHEVWTLVLL